jgi:hypothetical protein
LLVVMKDLTSWMLYFTTAQGLCIGNRVLRI